MIYMGKKAYDILTNTFSMGYWIEDSLGYWYPVWNELGKNVKEENEVQNDI